MIIINSKIMNANMLSNTLELELNKQMTLEA